jgi:hypothetical protein
VKLDAARLFGLAAACLAVWASHAAAATAGIGIGGVPKHAAPGSVMHVTATTPDVTASCSLSVHYKGGGSQAGLGPAFVVGGTAQWVWTVPMTVRAGVAHVAARCGNVGASRTFLVLGKVTRAPAVPSKAKGGFGVSGIPGHVVSGTVMHVTATTVGTAGSCSLAVRYKGGRSQPGLGPAFVVGGRAQWVWTIPPTVTAGVAHASARCGNASTTRAFLVVGRVTTTPVPVDKGSVIVVKSGFTTRPDPSGSTRLSYGVILHNTSTTRDAGTVTLQTNFVMADGHLLGTDTERISGIAEGSDFAYGNTVYFPQAAPIVRLEFVVSVDNFQPHKLAMPTLVNLHLVPENFQPQWVGTIEGEIQNTNTALTLHGVQLSAVVFDAGGNVIGGSSGGYVSDVLPVGARAFLQISNLDVLPTDQAAAVMVSMVPTWATS